MNAQLEAFWAYAQGDLRGLATVWITDDKGQGSLLHNVPIFCRDGTTWIAGERCYVSPALSDEIITVLRSERPEMFGV